MKLCQYCYPFIITTLLLTLAGCSMVTVQDGAPLRPINIKAIPSAKPRYLPKSRYGNPSSYVVNGERYYVLKSAAHYNRRGIASWYGTKFHGRLTSTRKPFNMYAMTAASPVLPIPCFVQVTNLRNGRQIIVKVNDRGPFVSNRIIDLSYAAAVKLGYAKKGTALVQVTALDMRHPKLQSIPIPQEPHLFLQIGAFTQRENALHLRAKAEQAVHKPVQIKAVRWHHQTLYRVQIGPLKNVEESDTLQQYLTQTGYPHAVTVIH